MGQGMTFKVAVWYYPLAQSIHAADGAAWPGNTFMVVTRRGIHEGVDAHVTATYDLAKNGIDGGQPKKAIGLPLHRRRREAQAAGATG